MLSIVWAILEIAGLQHPLSPLRRDFADVVVFPFSIFASQGI